MRWSSWAGRQHGKQWAGLCAGQRGPKGLGGGGKALISPVQRRQSAGHLPSPRETDGGCQTLHNFCLTKNNIPAVVSQKRSAHCHQKLLMPKNQPSPLQLVPAKLLAWVFNPPHGRFFYFKCWAVQLTSLHHKSENQLSSSLSAAVSDFFTH